MITTECYCTREEVKGALDAAETARSNDRIDRAIESATTTVDGLLRRTFTPWTGTRYFRWPSEAYRTPWRLWLDRDELVNVTALTAGGVTIPATDYFPEPANSGPPYRSIEIDLASSAAFTAGTTAQRAIAVTGTFGYSDVAEPVGVLSGALVGTQGATATVTWSTPRVGTGHLLRVDNERILVTDRDFVSSGQALLNPMTLSAANVTVTVTDGTAFAEEETILLDAERMRIVSVAGNTLTVKRAFDGSVLATHTGSTIYTLTGITLARAQAGTTIAAHNPAATITRHVPPPQVRDLALAYALNQLLQEAAGFARVAGSGDNQREISGRGIRSIEDAALVSHGRQFLTRAV